MSRYCRGALLLVAAVCIICLPPFSSNAHAGEDDSERVAPYLNLKNPAALRSLILDGSFIHNAGNLQMNVTNWGFFGSLPKSAYPMADAPSAQWPAGSGIEFLYAAGFWVGANLWGIPAVSTAYPETEFYPSPDADCRIYRSFEGAVGGNRLPSIFADDDGDGVQDEDWLNGRDDDGDGRIDEDFAAVGKQMFSCWYTDDQRESRLAWPEHTPLSIRVRQESYAWSEELCNDFVGVRYYVTNLGEQTLMNVHLGLYADVDAGPREWGSYFREDLVGYWDWRSNIWCAKRQDGEMPVRMSLAYVYDADGDGGKTPGYFGVMVLGHMIDRQYGMYAPTGFRGLNKFEIFRSLLPYENGGEPTNDYQRYDALSAGRNSVPPGEPRDYRILIGVGPFPMLDPGQTIYLDVAFVAGNGLDGMLSNAAQAALVYKGIMFNKDGRLGTGVKGRETPLIGPINDIDPDYCDEIPELYDVDKFDTIWVNDDCYENQERFNYRACYHGTIPYKDFFTGYDGKEAKLDWITGTTPPAPSMRLVPGEHMVTVYWDNLSEIVPDLMSGAIDFEGYEVWRSEGWHRPLGSTTVSGPGFDTWDLLDRRDLVNAVPPNRSFEVPFEAGGYRYEPMMHRRDRAQLLDAFEATLKLYPLDEVPCPPGLTEAECDTLEALARWRLGFEGGRRYYKYEDHEAKNGLPYFYSVTAFDHVFAGGVPSAVGRFDYPTSNFAYTVPLSAAQLPERFRSEEVYVVPNPVTAESMAPWLFSPNNEDPTGLKVEFRNLPRSLCTVRIFTISGDLVQTLRHDGTRGSGTLAWDLVSRNAQDVASGVYLFSVDADDGRFPRVVGKFVVIR